MAVGVVTGVGEPVVRFARPAARPRLEAGSVRCCCNCCCRCPPHPTWEVHYGTRVQRTAGGAPRDTGRGQVR